MSGLTSPKTTEYLSSISTSFANPMSDRLSIEVRANSNATDSIIATFNERGSSGQVQINNQMKQESIYSRTLTLRADGEFFKNAVLSPFTPATIEALWGRTLFQWATYEESYSNTTFTKGSNGDYAISAMTGETIVGGMNGTPNATFMTYASSVPEPSSAALMAIGLFGVAFKRRKQTQTLFT